MSSSSISTAKQKGDLYLASSLCDGVEDNNLKQLTTLLRNKDADPNVLMPLTGITPFHLVIGNDSEAFAEEVTKLFLRHGGNPNIKSVDGMTPVHVAAAWGRKKILELLLANGGDPLCLDSDNCSPFHYAFQGEHYEAVSILSKYCITEEDEDENPKFKRELDKVLVNNGEVLAEYIVSDDSSINNSLDNSSFRSDKNKNYKIESSGYVPENSSTDAVSLNGDFVTLRRKQRKRTAPEEADNISNKYKENFDFKRDTAEEEMHLISEIISQLSSSITSDVDPSSNATFQNYESDCLTSCKTSSPKKMQISMTFNRPRNIEYHKQSEKQTNSKRNSTLQVIKKHNCLPHLRNNKMMINNIKKSSTISEKNLTDKKPTKSPVKSVVRSESKTKILVTESLLQNKWLDETIISKSPNLGIDMQQKNKNKKFLKTPTFEKKVSPYTKTPKQLSAITPKNLKIQSPIKSGHSFTPVSRIPRPKKYFTTPNNFRTSKRIIETPPKTVDYNKHKIITTKKISTNERPKRVTPLNQTYSKSEVSTTPTSSINTEQSHKSSNKRRSLKSIAMNLDNYMYDEENSVFKEKSSNESRHLNDKYVPTFERKVKNLPESELISGVGMLDSEFKSRTESKLSSHSNRNEDISSSLDIDLNRAIFDSLTSLDSKKNKYNARYRQSKNINESVDAFDSLVCEANLTSSDSNDSFLSVNKIDRLSNLSSGDNIIKEEDNINSVSPDSNFVSLTDGLSSIRKTDSESFFSVEEEYKYEDPEEGVVFLERRLCVSPSCAPSDMNTSFYSCSTTKSEPLPKELFLLDSITLRERLKSLGENPGPITKTTHHLYLKRLHRLESQGRRPIQQNFTSNIHSRNSVSIEREKELMKISLLSVEWIKYFDDFEVTEQKIFQEFATPNPSRKWREGTSKSSFNYLLLDPRITNDLPRRSKLDHLTLSNKWETFLSAIFYVGKGKKSRPYAHLYDAFKIWISKSQRNVNSQKIQRILDIWNEGKGVVVLHVFHNTIPVEAYTREALMIEVLGTQKLGNCKCGDYYGVVSTWRAKEKCELGRYLLFKAMQILLLEGERQIFPDNL